MRYEWGYHGDDTQHVHVCRIDGDGPASWQAYSTGQAEDLFDITLYDREVIDETTGRNSEDQSLLDLRELIGYANAALAAGLEPLPVPDKIVEG